MTQTAPARHAAPAPTRLAHLDLGRVIAIIAIVALHVCSAPFWAHPLGSAGWWLADIGYVGTRWSVPLFILISGALILGGRSVTDPGSFYRSRAALILVPAAAWTAIYYVYRAANGENITPGLVAREVASGQPYVHLWFVSAILGLYLLAPLVAPALRSWTTKAVVTAGALALGIAVATRLLQAGYDLREADPTILTTFIPYVGYFLAGYALSRLELPAWTVPAAAAAFTVTLVAQVVLVHDAMANDRMGTAYAAWSYVSPLTAVQALGAFVLLQRVVLPARVARAATALGPLSFGVFLAHLLVLAGVIAVLDIVARSSMEMRAAAFALTVVGSFLLVAALRRLPVLRRIT